MGSERRPKNWVLCKVRQWHGYVGVAAALFVILAGASGIVLNHKDALFGREKKPEHAAPVEGAGRLTAATDIAAIPVGFGRAMEIAADRLGAGTEVERLALVSEGGRLSYRVKARGGSEVIVDADSGATEVVSEYRRPASRGGGFDWGKFIKDLHTGKIAGEGGKLVVDAVAVALMGLSASGLYLWGVAYARKRAAVAPAAGVVRGTPVIAGRI